MNTSKAACLACPALRDSSTTMERAFRIALLLIVAWALVCITPRLHAQSQATSNPAAVNAPIDRAAPVDPDDDADAADNDAPRWPMRVAVPQGTVTVYQPQLTGFENDRLTGRAAFSLIPFEAGQAANADDDDDDADPDAPQPIFGALWLESRVMTDRAARTVRIMDVKVTRVHLPSQDAKSQPPPPSPEALGQALAKAFADDPMVLSLDQLIAMLDQVEKDAQAVKDLDNAPPKVVFVNRPAVLVQFDGQPRFVATQGNSDLLEAVNTPFFVVMDKRIRRYYLKGAGSWYIAREASGPYLNIQTVPDEVSQLAASEGYIDPQQAMADAQDTGQIDAPAIVTATEPTELVWTLGTEELSPIEGTNLLYVTNTDSDIILDIDSQQIYLLLSGRWYRSTSRQGPWTYIAPDKLPADFARIPTDSDKGSVLAHVAGTQMARDAIADSYVPQTAAIDRTQYEQPPVEYDGEPQFEPIPELPITYAVNTPNAVLYINNRYYVCYNAVWYESAYAQGPWDLCVTVPREVYLIPPSVPVYPVRYVRIYDVTPSVIHTGYLPGYVGCYTYGGTVVYGTGYHYRPWYGHRFYARPYTWGFSPRYDPYHAYWGFNVGINFGSGVSLWFGASNRYVTTRSVWFGYGGYRPAYHRHHPRHVWHDRHDRWRNDRDRRRAYQRGYRDARDRHARSDRGPRRRDLNLYERRADVIRTAARGREMIDRDDRARRAQRAQRIDDIRRNQTTRRFDRRNDRPERDDRINRPEQPRRDDNRSDRAQRPETPARPDRATPDRPNRRDDDRTITRSPAERYQPNPRNPRNPQNARDARNPDTPRDARNNLFADEDGNVYRKTLDGWERRESNRWVPTPRQTAAEPAVRGQQQNPRPTTRQPRRSQDDTTASPSQRYRTNRNAQRDSQQGTINPWRGSNPRQQRQRDSSPDNDNAPRQRANAQPRPQPTDRATSQDRNTRDPGAVRSNTPTRATPEPAQRRTTRSLNSDYRARVRGQQRQQMHQQEIQRRATEQRGDRPQRQAPSSRQTPSRQATPQQRQQQQAAPQRERSRSEPAASPGSRYRHGASNRDSAPARGDNRSGESGGRSRR